MFIYMIAFPDIFYIKLDFTKFYRKQGGNLQPNLAYSLNTFEVCIVHGGMAHTL